MTNEQTFFLQILSDHLNGRQTTPQENIDWSVMMTYAQNHQVNGIVYIQCKDFLPDKVGQKLQRKYFSELYYYYNREALYKKVQQAFCEAQIPFFTVKGLAVAQFYPVPALRTMGDCDIVVHPEDKEKAHAVMMALGFECQSNGENEWVYFKNKMEFEIHDHLLYDELFNTESSRRYTDLAAWEKASSVSNESFFVLEWSFHFIFLLLHLRKHLVFYGVGFRQFMDLAVLSLHCDLNWNWLQKTLEEFGLRRFFQICLALLNRWFEIALPYKTPMLDDAFYEETTEKIIANGVFGFDEEANQLNGTINAIICRSGPRWLARATLLIGSIFPSYRNMRTVSYYAFVDKRPWLLPAAWIYRFYRFIRYHLTPNGKHLIENAMTPNEKLDSRKEILTKWGL